MSTGSDRKELDKDGNPEKAGRLADRIISAVREIRYGSVEIIIHESKVVQIEKREKIRL